MNSRDTHHDDDQENPKEESWWGKRKREFSDQVSGVAAKCVWQLWPFVVAYFRERISYDHLETACLRVLGETGKELASRIPYALIFGPVFAWYLLARVVMGLTRSATPKHSQVRYLSYNTAT